MRQEAQIELPETSYSALLHGPDTPPSQSEPAWGTPDVELENSAVAASSLQMKGMRGDQMHLNELLPGRDQGSLHQYAVEPGVVFQPGIKQNFPEQFKGKDPKKSEICLEVPLNQNVDSEHSKAKKQTWPAHFTEYRTQHLGECFTQGKQVPHSSNQLSCQQGIHDDKNLNQHKNFVLLTQEWEGQKQIPSDASLQSAYLDPSHDQRQNGKSGEIIHNQQESGHASNDMVWQQHNSWNVPQARMINTGFINQPQPHADADYTDWGWQQGQHFSENTPSYSSDNLHMGPNYAEHGWYMGPTALAHPASAMASSFPPFNAEGFYPPATRSAREGAGFGSIQANIGPQVNYLSATSCIGGAWMPRMPMNGAGHNKNWPGLLEQQDFGQKEFGPMVHAGGQMGQSQLHSNAGQHVVNSMQGMQRHSAKPPSDNVTDMTGSLCERDDLEGPKLKKQRDFSFSEVNIHPYNLRPGQPSSNFARQNSRSRAAPSSDACIKSQGDGTLARKNISYVQGVRSSFVGSEKSHNIQPVFENSCSESALSHESCSSEGINGVIPRSAIPPHLACSPVEVGMHGPVQSFPQSVLPFQSENMQGPVNDNCHQSEQANGTWLQEKSVNSDMTQLGDRAQVASSSSVLKAPVSSRSVNTGKTLYHTRMSSHGVQSFAQHTNTDFQSSSMSPWNDFETPNSTSMSSMSNQDGQGMHNIQPGGSFFCTPMGQPIGVQPQLQGQRTTQSPPLVKSAHLNSLRPPFHPHEVNQFADPTAVPPDTSSQLRRFSSAVGQYYPPPPFQSPPMHPYTGSMEKETYHHSAVGDLVGMGKHIPVSESGTELQPLYFSEAGNMRSQSLKDNVLYTQSFNSGVPKDVVRGTSSGHKIVEPQESAKLSSRPFENEHVIFSQVSAYDNVLASEANIRQVNGDHHHAAFHIGHQNSGMDCATFQGQEQTFSPKVAPGQLSQRQFVSPKADLHAPIALQPKKRKKPLPFLIPWHIAATQPRVQLPPISKAEVIWANAANRIPEKDGGEILDGGPSKVQNRLRVTTQLMQQLISPLPSVLMYSDKPMEYEHGVYYLTRFAFGEACRLMAGFEREPGPAVKSMDIKSMGIQGQARMSTRMKGAAMTKLVERFMERVKRLDLELARFECSRSALELRSKSHELEHLSLVNRLSKHYGKAFSLDSDSKPAMESLAGCNPPPPPPAAVGGIRRLPPQKYVIPVPMSRTTLPEGIRCLSL